MALQRPVTETVKSSEARQQLPTLLKRVFHREARVLVEKSGIPVAAIISANDLEWLERFEQQREAGFAIVDELREACKGVSSEEIEREVDRALAEIRAEEAASVR
ncbi:MAG: type II toxin-antitoxin system prevent-host-death family antitoxin [Thermomicrobiales bacterium]